MNTVIIFTGPHYPADRHQFDNCNRTLTDSLCRMASRKPSNLGAHRLTFTRKAYGNGSDSRAVHQKKKSRQDAATQTNKTHYAMSLLTRLNNLIEENRRLKVSIDDSDLRIDSLIRENYSLRQRQRWIEYELFFNSNER